MFNHGGQAAFEAGHRVNGSLLGFKFGVWEGDHRVPFIARWPGKIKPGTTSTQLISSVDLLAKFAALTQQTLDKSQLADSVNVLPALIGEPEDPLRDTLVLCPHSPAHLAVRKGKWVYIGAQGEGDFGGKPGTHAAGGPIAASFVGNVNSDIENGRIKKDAPPAQLYDLEAHVNQTRNLHNEHPEVVKQMSALLAGYAPQRPGPKKGKDKSASKREHLNAPSKPGATTPVAASSVSADNKPTIRSPNFVVIRSVKSFCRIDASSGGRNLNQDTRS
jgi:arylsulfatase A